VVEVQEQVDQEDQDGPLDAPLAQEGVLATRIDNLPFYVGFPRISLLSLGGLRYH